MDTDTNPFESQIAMVTEWFITWNETKRDRFFEVMLEKTPRSTVAVDDLTTAFSFGFANEGNRSPFDQQLQQFCIWFACWSDKVRNTFLDILEGHDLIRVIAFVERFCQRRW